MPRGGKRENAGRKPVGDTTSIRLPEDLRAQIQGLAQQFSMTESDVVRGCLQLYLKAWETVQHSQAGISEGGDYGGFLEGGPRTGG